MWKLTCWAKTRDPLPGVPWRDMTDEEFATVEAMFPEGALRERGYFKHVETTPAPAAEESDPAPLRRGRTRR